MYFIRDDKEEQIEVIRDNVTINSVTSKVYEKNATTGV